MPSNAQRPAVKILHLITGLDDGGAEGVLFRLVTQDRQHSHCVVSLTDLGKYGPLLHQQGIPVTALAMPRGRISLRGLIRLWQLLRDAQAALMQTWMYHADLLGGVVGQLAGLPVVWGIRNSTLDPARSARTTHWVVRSCARLSHWLPVRIVVCAHAAVAVHAALGYDASRMRVIPNGYDLSRFQPDRAARERLRAQWGMADTLPVIGMAARFDPQKDHANLIDALQRLAAQGFTFRAILVGRGVTPDNTALSQQIRAAGLAHQVQLLGAQHDIPAVMNALDLHVLSSAYGEAFPNVLAEAMACGTPCVTTDVGDAAYLVGDTGWVVAPRDAPALAAALAQALTAWRDAAAWQERQHHCRQRIARHFTLAHMIQGYHEVWQEAIACAD